MRALPLSRSAPIVARTPTFARSDPIITARRGSRSATTPPTRSVATWASVQQANAMPVSVADPVRSRTANATAIGARYVPKYETARAKKRSTKLRLRSSALLPVALQPGVRLPERHRLLVLLETAVHVRRHALGEVRFRHAVEGGPRMEPPPQLVEVPRDIVGDSEMDQREALGRAALDLVQRREPEIEVELGRRRRRQHGLVWLDADAGGVAGIQRAVAVEVADVVRCMSGRRETLEPEHALADDVHVRLRN